MSMWHVEKFGKKQIFPSFFFFFFLLLSVVRSPEIPVLEVKSFLNKLRFEMQQEQCVRNQGSLTMLGTKQLMSS